MNSDVLNSLADITVRLTVKTGPTMVVSFCLGLHDSFFRIVPHSHVLSLSSCLRIREGNKPMSVSLEDIVFKVGLLDGWMCGRQCCAMAIFPSR